jgi:hypothetical protein
MEDRDDRHNLRLPKDLKAKLAHARIDSGRSMNAEILARLERSFEPDPAAQIVEALRPIASLSDDERGQVGVLLAGIGAIFAGAGASRKK